MDVVVRVYPPGDQWRILGADIAPGVTPGGVTLTANESGPDTCSFTLRRTTLVPWRDLLPFSQVEVEVPGAGVVWGGRVWDVSYPDASTVQVACRGWQYALDDNLLSRTWIHSQLSDWVDFRTLSTGVADPTNWVSDAVSGSGAGSYTLTLPNRALSANYAAGMWLDLGESAAKSVSVDYATLANTSANVAFYVQGYTDTSLSGGLTAISYATNAMVAAPYTETGDFSSLRRYIRIALYCTSGYTPGASPSIQITGIRVYRDTAYRSGGAADLSATEVITDLLTNYLTMLSTDTTLVATTTFDIPHLSYVGQYVTPRQVLTAVNAYHDYLLGVDAEKRLFFTQRPTTAVVEVGEWSGAAFSDQGETGEELYNRVLVQGTGVDGRPLTVERTATANLLTAAGITRAKTLGVNASITTASAEAIGDAWLATRNVRPTRGSISVTGGAAVRGIGSNIGLPAAHLLRLCGQRIRLAHRWDPDDGSIGREGSITSVTWNADTDTAQVTLDSPRDRLDVLLGRLAAARGAGLPLQ